MADKFEKLAARVETLTNCGKFASLWRQAGESNSYKDADAITDAVTQEYKVAITEFLAEPKRCYVLFLGCSAEREDTIEGAVGAANAIPDLDESRLTWLAETLEVAPLGQVLLLDTNNGSGACVLVADPRWLKGV